MENEAKTSEHCPCGAPLIWESERDFGYCEDCLDAQYSRSRERADWDHWHPGDPLTPENKG